MAQETKIGIIWHCVFPWDVRLEKFAQVLSETYKIHIISRGRSNLPDHEMYGESIIHRIFVRLTNKNIFLNRVIHLSNVPYPFNPFWAYKVFLYIMSRKIETIIIRDLPLMWLGILIKLLLKKTLIFDMAENYPAALMAYQKKVYKPILIFNALGPRLYEYIAAKISDAIYVVCEEQKNRLMSSGVSRHKIIIVRNTPIIDFSMKTVINNNVSGNKTLLYVGKIDVHRGVEVAIKSLGFLVNEFPEIRLLLVGDGTESKHLQQLTLRLGLKKYVKFYGWLNHREIYEIISSSHICLIPHLKSEHTDTTIPNKLFDYMLCGKPVISSYLIPVARIINEFNCGYIYDNDDPCELSKAIAMLIRNEKSQFFGKNGEAAIREHFNWFVDSAKLIRSISN